LTHQTSFVLVPICRPGPTARISSIPFYANLLQFLLLQAARPQQLGFLQPHATRNFYSSRSFKPPRPLPVGFLQYLATRNLYSFSTRPNHYRSDFFSLPREASTALAPSSRPGHHSSDFFNTLLRETSTVLAPSSRPGHYRSDFFNSLPREPSTALAPSSRTGHYRSDFFNPTPCGTSIVLAPSSCPEAKHMQSLPRGFASRSCSSKPLWLSSDFFKSRSLHPPTILRRSTATGYKPNSYTTNRIFCHHEPQEPRLKTFTTVPHSVSTAYRFGA
jgi:hypothetical protein